MRTTQQSGAESRLPDRDVWTASQEDIDDVAFFVEAVDELRRTPLFVEEYRNLGVTWVGGLRDPHSARGRFPDPAHVAAALIPFRRIWQQNNRCHYRHIAKILKRTDPQEASLVDSFVFSDRTSMVQSLPFVGVAPSPSEAVDMWLNARQFHTGMSNSVGKHTRADLDRVTSVMGRDMFEFYTLSTVHEAGLSFINLQMFAKMFLSEQEAQGRRPSFEMAEPPEPGPERSTPGFPAPTDTPAHRVWRLKRRNRYHGLGEFLNLLPFADKTVAEGVTKHEKFGEFVESLGIRMQQVESVNSIHNAEMDYMAGAIDAFHTAARNRRSRRGYVGRRMDGVLLWCEEYVPILRDQYLEFREALLREPFV